MASLGEWLERIKCSALLDQLDDYGVETTEDLLLLDPPDVKNLAGLLKKVQAKKFETALDALRGGGDTAESAAVVARVERAEKLADEVADEELFEDDDSEGEEEGSSGDAVFAVGAKFLTLSTLRDGEAAFDAPEAAPNVYEAAPTGALVQPSLFEPAAADGSVSLDVRGCAEGLLRETQRLSRPARAAIAFDLFKA